MRSIANQETVSRRVPSIVAVLAAVLVSLLASDPALASGDANEPECPAATEASPGFRTYLPDCRAYEMVTPQFKDGAELRVQALSSDGSRLIVSSLGAFAGTEGDPLDATEGAAYELARSESGWVASPITPPASLSPDARLFGISRDASRVLWEVLGASKVVNAVDLDLREADGSFVKIGPILPPSAEVATPARNHGGENEEVIFAGTSNDLSRAIFSIRAANPAFLWPGDTTAPGNVYSLYEYVGTGNSRPFLVGENEEGHLISNCETALGSARIEGGGDAYNAVSANGEMVIFTAIGHNVNGCGASVAAPEVSELYARLDQFRTVAISEPSHSQCEQCETAVRSPAVFQGASEDGSKVFFLTEQELFAKDKTKNLYEYDFDAPEGEKVVRVSTGAPGYVSTEEPEVEGVARVSEDGSHVYFVARGILAGQNAEGSSPTLGANNLYVFERDAAYPQGRTAFVAALNSADSNDWEQRDSRPVQATPEGRFLVFQSVVNLTGDMGTLPQQVFEYDALQEKLVRVSIGAAGYEANANTSASAIPSQGYGQVSCAYGSRDTAGGVGQWLARTLFQPGSPDRRRGSCGGG